MRFRFVFGLYLGCSFFAFGPVLGQNLVKDGQFTEADPLVNWTPSDVQNIEFSNTGGPNGNDGYAEFFRFGDTTLSQQIAIPITSNYDLSFFIKNTNFVEGSFSASIDSTTVFSSPTVNIPSDLWIGGSGTPINLQSGPHILTFSFLDAEFSQGDKFFKLGDVLLKQSPSQGSNTAALQAAVLAANGLTGDSDYIANVTTAGVGKLIIPKSVKWIYNTMDITDEYKTNQTCSNNDQKANVKILIRQTTIDGNQVTQYYDEAHKRWYSKPPTDKDSSDKGLIWDPSSRVSTILPFFNTSKNLSTIPVNTIFADAGILSSLETLDVPGVNLLQAQVKNEKEKSTNSLKEIENIKRSLSQTLEEKAQNLNSISSKLGVSFDLLDINALQDIEDLVAGRFNDFVLNKETNVQKLKREFRKDLAYYLHASKSLAKIEKNLSVVTSGVTIFAEKYDLAIEKMNQKIKATDASLSKNLRICLAGLKKTAISLNEVFEHYAKGQKIVSELQDKVDVLAEKTKEILPKLYLLDVENASASLEADLQAELAMMDVMDEEHLVAASDLSSSKQVSKDATITVIDNQVNVWGRALGQYMHQSKSSTSSAFSSGTGGALVGADWKVADHKLGFAATYMYTYMGQNHNSGHVNINQGGLAPYGSFVVSDWKLDTSIYGGYTYNTSHRNSLAGTVKYHAHSNSHAWQLAPHLEVSYTGLVKDTWWTANPYVMGDYVANWSSAFREKGSSDYNTKQKASFSGFIRTETGFSFDETIFIKYGQLILREKAAWAYQRSLASSTSSVSVVGTTGAFVVPNNAFIQNLAVAEFAITFISPKKHVPNIEVSYGGQFGSKFISQLGSINLSKDF